MGETLTSWVVGSKTSLERIQNGVEEEELDPGSSDNTVQKILQNKVAEKGGVTWKEIGMQRVFS